jgi:RNA polymerase sigma-70 factor (TIGR02943 family)
LPAIGPRPFVEIHRIRWPDVFFEIALRGEKSFSPLRLSKLRGKDLAPLRLASRMHTQPPAMVAYLAEPQQSDPVDLVDKHGDYLHNYALGQLRDKNDAEDVVQETFLAALKARDRFKGDASERTWLVSILRHKICDYLWRKCRERPVPNNLSEARLDESMLWIHETAAKCLLPSRRLDLNDFRESLETALHTLPPRIAQAFAMYEIDECDNADICSRMHISEGNLWTMVHRARKQLRQLLPKWRNETNNVSRPC